MRAIEFLRRSIHGLIRRREHQEMRRTGHMEHHTSPTAPNEWLKYPVRWTDAVQDNDSSSPDFGKDIYMAGYHPIGNANFPIARHW